MEGATMYTDDEIAIAFAMDVLREKVAHMDASDAVERLRVANGDDNDIASVRERIEMALDTRVSA